MAQSLQTFCKYIIIYLCHKLHIISLSVWVIGMFECGKGGKGDIAMEVLSKVYNYLSMPLPCTACRGYYVTSNLHFADEDDLADVRSALFPIASQWKDVGIELRLKLSDLNAIQAAHPMSSEDCLTLVVNEWLQKKYNTTKHGPPSWRKLVRVISLDTGGKNPLLAKKVAENHRGK